MAVGWGPDAHDDAGRLWGREKSLGSGMADVKADLDSRGGQLPGGQLSFLSDSPGAFVDHVLELISEFCGILIRKRDTRDGHVDVYHGNDGARACSIRIPVVQRYTVESIPLASSSEDDESVFVSGAPFPFDFFSATRFWLADEGNVELADSAYDSHERLIASQSANERIGVRDLPIVNTYLIALRRWLQARLGVVGHSHLPAGKKCILVLSHDVDRPLDPLNLGPTLKLAANSFVRGGSISSVWYGSIAAGKALHALGTDRTARQWLFDELADEEERRGFRSTFFVAPTSRFSKEGSYFDVEYDVRQPKFRNASLSLVERGFEIGLHVGYHTRGDVTRLRREKELLEDAVGTSVIGSRHHYWHLGRPPWPALQAHGDIGICYDSSMAFNDARGYRLGTAFPFRPWNPELERPIECLQIPTVLMDRDENGFSVEAALARLEGVLECLKRCEGIAAIDWHQETALPRSKRFRRLGQAYLASLDLLAADPQVAVRSFEQVITTFSSRTQAF
jgi:hypothetical protein